MQKVKILGSWDQTYIVRDSSDAIKQAKKLNDRYPHLNLRIHGINHLGDIGEAIQSYVEKEGFSVVRDFCGHGIGKIFHTPPNILHYGKKGEGIKLEPGMIFTIEPMINEGIYNTKLLKDGWTAVTKDKSLSAQFEHTIGVTHEGFEIFTKSKKKYEKPPYII